MKDAQALRRAVRAADARLVEAHPWLGRDDLVAAALFVGALAGSALVAAGFLLGVVPAWVAVLLLMLAGSVVHELEHDLIHELYLSRWQTPMLAVIWLYKANLDPWTRMHMHRWHHVASGQAEDIEERLIGLGLPWGPLRLLITCLPAASIVMHPSLKRAVQARRAIGAREPDPRAYRIPLPFILGNVVLFLSPVVVVVALALGAAWAWPMFVLWVLPNLLRHACIVTMSSNSHYVDIDRGEVLEQNQVLDHWLFWPLQVFCWNFGATHVLHHLLVKQPFWRRTLVFPEVKPALVEAGIPVNDLGTFGRANRRTVPPLEARVPER